MLKTFIKNLNQLYRHQWIAEAAYFKAQSRDFEPGKELDDWLAAEADYFSMLINLQLNVLEEDGTVTKMGLLQIAESIGVEHPERIHSEVKLIRAIQEASHHTPCFQSHNSPVCEERANCQWQEKCRRLLAIWHR